MKPQSPRSKKYCEPNRWIRSPSLAADSVSPRWNHPTPDSVGVGSVTTDYFSDYSDMVFPMPSTRRRFLWTLPVAGIGFAGCNNLTPTEREDNRTTTPSAQGELEYEPTTPAKDELAGTPYEEPEYVVQTPVVVFIRNYQDESRTVGLILEIEPTSGDPREVRNRSYEVPAGGSIEIGEFEQSGQYHFTAETADQRHEETTYISMNHLADCNSVSRGIVIEESGLSLQGLVTEIDCPPATATPEPTENADRD